MPQTMAWPLPEMGPASVMPARGNWLSLPLSVARARGKGDTCHLQNCQCHLPHPTPVWKSWWPLHGQKEKEVFFSVPLSLNMHQWPRARTVPVPGASAAHWSSTHIHSLFYFFLPCPFPFSRLQCSQRWLSIMHTCSHGSTRTARVSAKPLYFDAGCFGLNTFENAKPLISSSGPWKSQPSGQVEAVECFKFSCCCVFDFAFFFFWRSCLPQLILRFLLVFVPSNIFLFCFLCVSLLFWFPFKVLKRAI